MAVAAPRAKRRLAVPAELVFLAAAVVLVFREFLSFLFDGPAVSTWMTIFVSICIQAMPFLVLGVVLSGALATFVSPAAIARLLPKSPLLAVPAAGVAGLALPGCECSSVPIAGRLVNRGVPAAAAMTFLLAAPAINPIVLVATAVAFPGRPEMVAARFTASLLAAVIVGLVWVRIGREEWVERARRQSVEAGGRWATLLGTAAHDFIHAGAFLVVGGLAAATLQTVVPRSVLDGIAGSGAAAVVTMALLAVALSICSEADAFVAAGLSQFSLTSRLVFLVVGPMVDIKLIALQLGVFGKAFAARFAPLTFVTAIGAALVVSQVLLR